MTRPSALLLVLRFMSFLGLAKSVYRKTVLGKSNTLAFSFSSSRHSGRIRSVTKNPLHSSMMGFQEAAEEDQTKWEELYTKGEAADAEKREKDFYGSLTRSEVRVVTFDLDNTIWNTSATISAANDALFAYLDDENIHVPTRVEVVMKELYSASKAMYSPLLEEPQGPVLLTKLRVDALCHVLEEYNNFEPEKAREYAQHAFQVWTKARHDAAANNMAESVIPCLESIAKLRGSNGNPVIIGAITDGNSNPREVAGLDKYFEFCINAESVGVGKPDKRVYMEAIKHVSAHPSMQDIFEDFIGKDLEEAVGPYWVHVGDDFIKDIVASKSLKMRSVWATELIRDKLPSKKNESVNQPPSTVGDEEVQKFVKKMTEQNVVKMQIGADSYLTDSLQSEFVDVIVDEFKHLSEVLSEWHEEGLSKRSESLPTKKSDVVKEQNKPETSDDIDTNSFLAVTMPDDISNGDQSAPPEKSAQALVSPTVVRGFRLTRDKYSVDIIPPKDASKSMQDILKEAQKDKSSGVFSFPKEEIALLQAGKANLNIRVGDAKLELPKDVLTKMTVEEVMNFSTENPVVLELFIKETSADPGYDIF